MKAHCSFCSMQVWTRSCQEKLQVYSKACVELVEEVYPKGFDCSLFKLRRTPSLYAVQQTQSYNFYQVLPLYPWLSTMCWHVVQWRRGTIETMSHDVEPTIYFGSSLAIMIIIQTCVIMIYMPMIWVGPLFIVLLFLSCMAVKDLNMTRTVLCITGKGITL